MSTPRCVFMGTPELAIPSLRLLHQRCRVSCVITQPDRPAGRGKRLQPPAVKRAAEELGLPVWQPERLRAHPDDPRLQDQDLFVVLAYGEILTQQLLDLPRGACINLHASLLPAWRGASPLQAALRAGDTEGGVSVMRMVRALDAGPVYLQERVALEPQLTLPEWHDRVAELSARALDRFLAAWPAIDATHQDPEQATYCGKLTTADGRLDFHDSAEALARHIRAYTPVPGCWCLLGEQRLRVQAARALPGSGSGSTLGRVERHPDGLLVHCGVGQLLIERLQPPGKRSMAASAFVNGYGCPDLLA